MYKDEDVNERVLEDIAETAQAAIDDGEICDMEDLEDFIIDQLDRFDIDTENPEIIQTIIDSILFSYDGELPFEELEDVTESTTSDEAYDEACE